MGRSQESFNKKEVRNKKEKKRKEKAAKRQAKRENENKSGLDDMIAYVDENGMITTTPPDESKKSEVKLEDIEVSVPKGGSVSDEDPEKKGVVTFYNESKGYGFIKEKDTKQDVFFHVNNLTEPIKEGNLVTFEIEKGQRGLTAVRVKVSK
ncbi:MAG: cold shock domain-containing protein [Prolixibacteraceae bacterium]|jgi:cold shock CspA family protein|nr:cold shock domain-containing protein [Prolixibacteraceae bacterium]